MLLKKRYFLLVPLLIVFSLKAFSFDKGILAIFLGYQDGKGYSFSLSEGLRAKIITFGEIEDSTLLEKYDLKDVSLVGRSFMLKYETGENAETGKLELNLLDLQQTASPDSLTEKHN